MDLKQTLKLYIKFHRHFKGHCIFEQNEFDIPVKLIIQSRYCKCLDWLSYHSDPIGYLISNFIDTRGNFKLHDIGKIETIDIYKRWKKYNDSLAYNTENDLKYLNKNIDTWETLCYYKNGLIHLETLSLLHHNLSIFKTEQKHFCLFKDTVKLAKQYSNLIRTNETIDKLLEGYTYA